MAKSYWTSMLSQIKSELDCLGFIYFWRLTRPRSAVKAKKKDSDKIIRIDAMALPIVGQSHPSLIMARRPSNK